MPTVPALRGKDRTTVCFSKNGRKAVQGSTIPIARLLPPLKRHARKRLDKVVGGEMGQGSKERRASGKVLEDKSRTSLEDTKRRGLEDTSRRGLEDTIRRGRSRERTGSEKSTKKGESKNFAETEGASQEQPSRENLVALIEHNHVFDEVATRRELHFLIRSLIRSLMNIEKASVALTEDFDVRWLNHFCSTVLDVKILNYLKRSHFPQEKTVADNAVSPQCVTFNAEVQNSLMLLGRSNKRNNNYHMSEHIHYPRTIPKI